jgi:hypothetical protein
MRYNERIKLLGGIYIMDDAQVKYVESLSISEADRIEREDLCKNCGLWPCYATAPDCFRYEDEA